VRTGLGRKRWAGGVNSRALCCRAKDLPFSRAQPLLIRLERRAALGVGVGTLTSPHRAAVVGDNGGVCDVAGFRRGLQQIDVGLNQSKVRPKKMARKMREQNADALICCILGPGFSLVYIFFFKYVLPAKARMPTRIRLWFWWIGRDGTQSLVERLSTRPKQSQRSDRVFEK